MSSRKSARTASASSELLLALHWYKQAFRTSADLAQAKDTQNLRDEVADLCQQENYLDALLRSTTSAMNLTREDPTDVPYQCVSLLSRCFRMRKLFFRYLTYNDLHALEDLQRKMLIALKSPTGSRCCLQTPINNEIVSKARALGCSMRALGLPIVREKRVGRRASSVYLPIGLCEPQRMGERR